MLDYRRLTNRRIVRILNRSREQRREGGVSWLNPLVEARMYRIL